MDGKLYEVFCMLIAAHGGSTEWDCTAVKSLPGTGSSNLFFTAAPLSEVFLKGVDGVVVVAGTMPDRSRLCARVTLRCTPPFGSSVENRPSLHFPQWTRETP